MKAHWLFVIVCASALGCGGSDAAKIVPVSGVVTLNGKPLAGATVAFSPVAKEGDVNAGDGSVGKTNADGEYTLTTSRSAPGAQVGKHRVRISVLSQQSGGSDERPPRGGWPLKDKIPGRYNDDTKLIFEVTPNGPNNADFALTSP
jgi:hypothetical protein